MDTSVFRNILLACCCRVLFTVNGTAVPERSLQPSIAVSTALDLQNGSFNENFATKNQAMNVWHDGAAVGKELVVGLVHRYNNFDIRSDDEQYGVVWESDGNTLREIQRVRMSCSDVELAVPSKGPYVYEARLDLAPWSLHPECSCLPSQTNCIRGVLAANQSMSWNLTSPIQSHYVVLYNEWKELIADPGTLPSLNRNFNGSVNGFVSRRVTNATSGAPTDPALACPGSIDDEFGKETITRRKLRQAGMQLPDGYVKDRWCLVKRGGCSITAKVKVCEISGAIGTIIVDHGNLLGDQSVAVVYSRKYRESALQPVLFVSKAEGEALAVSGNVNVSVGPNIGGPPPQSFSPGSGVVVHALGGQAPSGQTKKSYPNIFGTVGWIEASNIRDLLFVCLPSAREIRIYNNSQPLVQLPLLSTIRMYCSRYGLHDYRVLDYQETNGDYKTLFVDPSDVGNALVYFNTTDASNPEFVVAIHANWEADRDGLGHVRPGGPGGVYHFVTWHCSDLFCGKNHGDALYVLNSENFRQGAKKIPLPMLSKGGFARDIACNNISLCLLTLTWDGIVAVDSGMAGTRNKFGVVAQYIRSEPFSSARIPFADAYLRMYSGAQKVYKSHHFADKFYIEHADFSLRALRMGDVIQALQIKQLYVATVNYNPTVQLSTSQPNQWTPELKNGLPNRPNTPERLTRGMCKSIRHSDSHTCVEGMSTQDPLWLNSNDKLFKGPGDLLDYNWAYIQQNKDTSSCPGQGGFQGVLRQGGVGAICCSSSCAQPPGPDWSRQPGEYDLSHSGGKCVVYTAKISARAPQNQTICCPSCAATGLFFIPDYVLTTRLNATSDKSLVQWWNKIHEDEEEDDEDDEDGFPLIPILIGVTLLFCVIVVVLGVLVTKAWKKNRTQAAELERQRQANTTMANGTVVVGNPVGTEFPAGATDEFTKPAANAETKG